MQNNNKNPEPGELPPYQDPPAHLPTPEEIPAYKEPLPTYPSPKNLV